MKPELKWLHSPDVDDLEHFSPEDPEKFGFLLQMMIGPEGGSGEDSFDAIVCTPAWLAERYGEDEVVFGRHHFIVQRYDYASLSDAIDRVLKVCSGRDWGEIVLQLSGFGHWEFEDYKP